MRYLAILTTYIVPITIVLIPKYCMKALTGENIKMTCQNGAAVFELDVYTHFNVLRGELRCPNGLRLLDLLNGSGPIARNIKGDFLEFNHVFDFSIENSDRNRYTSFIRKDSFQVVAASSIDLGRGVGAKDDWRSYPFVRKSLLPVSLQLHNYWLLGSMYLSHGQTTQDLLNEDRQFLPLTDVTIGSEQRALRAWPFVMVNKTHIIWLRERCSASAAA